MDYLSTGITDVAMLAQFLENRFSAPTTIKNYLSGAKSWVSHHCGDVSAFSAQEPSDVLKHITAASNHVTMQALSLSPVKIKIICAFIDRRPDMPPAIKACILITFASFLRASNITSRSTNHWGGPHTLQAKDVLRTNDRIILVVRLFLVNHQPSLKSTQFLAQIVRSELRIFIRTSSGLAPLARPS